MLDRRDIGDGLLRQLELEGELPEHLREPPELYPHLRLYYDAFWELDADRPPNVGNIPSAIPWGILARYAEFYGLDEEQSEDLFYLVRQLDNEYLKRCKAKAPKPKPPRT